jgi:hypothetical protein
MLANCSFLRFVSATFGRARFTTPVAKKTLSPTYPAADATFDFPVYLSLADNLGGLELLVWDKDLIKKEYLGEISLSLDDWFKNSESGDGLAFDHEHNYVRVLNFYFVTPRLATECYCSLSKCNSYPRETRRM